MAKSRLNPGVLTTAAVLALMAVTILLRMDLAEAALARAARLFARGGQARLMILAQAGLLLGILGCALRVVYGGAEFKRDAAVLAGAGFLGWAAEAWGTNLGLWTYYTAESPPLWIVPAWSIGALVVDRAARAVEDRLPYSVNAQRMLAACFALVIAGFSWPAWSHPATWALWAAAAGGLAGKPSRRAFSVLAAGAFCVFFADLWGTSARCWIYWLEDGGWARRLSGVGFGMAFDAALVAAALRATAGAAGNSSSPRPADF